MIFSIQILHILLYLYLTNTILYVFDSLFFFKSLMGVEFCLIFLSGCSHTVLFFSPSIGPVTSVYF